MSLTPDLNPRTGPRHVADALDAMGIGVAWLDPEFRFRAANRTYLDHLRLAWADCREQSILRTVPRLRPLLEPALTETLSMGRRVVCQAAVANSDGTTSRWEYVLEPDTPDGVLIQARPAVLEASPVQPIAVRGVGPGDSLVTVPGSGPLELVLVNQTVQMQQMFDQFQQTMMMMVQAFSTLYRDQMELMREELDQVHMLSRELQALQAELVNHSPPVAVRSGDPTRSESSGQRLSAGAAASRMPERDRVAPECAADPLPPWHPGNQSGADMHARLCQRITAIQRERQSRWQKILTLIMDHRPGEPLP